MARPSSRRGIFAGTLTEERIMRIAVIGIDLGKNVCSVIGLDERGTVVLL
jgi:hypothetical protein